MNGRKIDLVYTWVNGEDASYQQLCREYSRRPKDLNPERFRDKYSLLKYSLRTVDMYLPWIRHVYIVTCRPQVPEWLNLEYPRLHVVHHDEIIAPQYLPTFNCNTIESCLHEINNDSDHLLYCNDDFLFGREVEAADFLDAGGRIRVLGTLFGERFRYRTYDDLYLFSLAFIEHVPYLIHKPIWAEMIERYAKGIHRTRSHSFRKRTDVRMDRLYRYFLLTRHRRSTRVVPFYQLQRFHQFHQITNDLAKQGKRLEALQRKRPKFMCLNDDQGDCPNERVVELVRSFLEDLAPDKSCFEK